MIIGDAHAHPRVDNERFDWLGNLVADTKPDVLVSIGDFGDFPSLLGAGNNNYQNFENSSYREDLDSYLDARERLAKGTRKVHGIRLEEVLGNHEHRITKWLRAEPKLRGQVSLEDLQARRFGWSVSPFLQPITIDGVSYVHYFKRPGSELPVGGRAHSVIQKYPGSFSRVWGHSHKLEVYEVQDGSSNKKITAINCGMYCDPRDKAHEWAGTDIHAWRAGILTLGVWKGQIQRFRWYSLEELEEDYS